MKLLIVSSLWTGMIPFFRDGRIERTGMPAFYEVWIRLLNSIKIDKIDLIILYEEGQIDIWQSHEKYQDKLNVYPIKKENRAKLLLTLIRLIIKGWSLSSRNKYSFYFGFGPYSFVTWFFRLLHNVPDQRRLFGISVLYEDLKKKKIEIFFRHPFSYLSVALKCTNLFISNDGSHGDLVFEKIGNRNTNFHFYLNGVDIVPKDEQATERYILSYLGRIYPWKGQMILIDALTHLKKDYNLMPETLLVGQIANHSYYEAIKEKIERNGLVNVIIKDGVSSGEVYRILSKSMLTFSFYKTSNFGNVLIESFASGTPVITHNINNSLSMIPEDSYINVGSYSSDKIAKIIKHYIDNPQLREDVAIKGLDFIEKNISSWNERALKELNILNM